MHRSSAKKHICTYTYVSVQLYLRLQRAARIVPIYRSLLGRNARRDAESALEKKEEENPLCPSSRNDSRLRVQLHSYVRQFPLRRY